MWEIERSHDALQDCVKEMEVSVAESACQVLREGAFKGDGRASVEAVLYPPP